MKRIAILQILQESNAFNPMPMRLDEFERFGLGVGDEVVTTYGEVDEIGGFLEGLRTWEEPVELVGILRAQGWSGGPLATEAIAQLTALVQQQFAQAGPLDGVLFAVHGALVGEQDNDVDGYLLEIVCALVGPDVPIVATVDLHAYVTERMLAAADVIVAYHTSPHLDRRQTGVRASLVLQRILHGAIPTVAMVRIPMIAIAEAQNSAEPLLLPIYQRVQDWEHEQDVLSAAFLMTQAWLDVPELGWTALIYTDSNRELASHKAGELAELAWERRREMVVDFYSAQECITRALAIPGKPVVVADGADATNSGACGDSIHLLKALIATSIPGGALTIMVDPAAVAHAKAVGVGGTFSCSVGGKRDTTFSTPLPVTGKVIALREAAYILNGHGGTNLPVNMGTGAIVQINDVTVLFVEYAGAGGTPMMYRCVGLEPTDYKMVIVKSPAGFRADFAPFAAGILLADCPGCASPRFADLPYRHISRPLWPLDAIDDWHTVAWSGEVKNTRTTTA